MRLWGTRKSAPPTTGVRLTPTASRVSMVSKDLDEEAKALVVVRRQVAALAFNILNLILATLAQGLQDLRQAKYFPIFPQLGWQAAAGGDHEPKASRRAEKISPQTRQSASPRRC